MEVLRLLRILILTPKVNTTTQSTRDNPRGLTPTLQTTPRIAMVHGRGSISLFAAFPILYAQSSRCFLYSDITYVMHHKSAILYKFQEF